MATFYPQPAANTSIRKGGAAPYNTPVSGDIQPISVQRDGKLLDLFRDKMRRLHYALTTEKAYRRCHWRRASAARGRISDFRLLISDLAESYRLSAISHRLGNPQPATHFEPLALIPDS